MRKFTTMKVLRWTDGTQTPEGAFVSVCFLHNAPMLAEIWHEDTCHRIYVSRLGDLLYGFPKPPAAEKPVTSVYGKPVEPDGWDAEGSPSWLLALGVVK